MNRSGIFWIVAACATLVSANGKAQTLGPAEGKLQLSQIAQLLGGIYDNDPQRHYLDGMKRGATAPARLHLRIDRAPQSETGFPTTFMVEERDGSEHSAVTRRSKLTLENDPATRYVIMKMDGDMQRCEWQWLRHNGVWMGKPRGQCSSSPGIAGKTLWLGKDELWLETKDSPVMTELGRASMHECFIAARLRDGEPQIFTGLRVHDRGGTLDVTTNDKPARKLTLTLRRGMWPSNSGNNLLELLTLTVREDGQPAVVGSGWATPESPRVGFGNEEEAVPMGRSINSRCKRIEQ